MTNLLILHTNGTEHACKLTTQVLKGANSTADTQVHLLFIQGNDLVTDCCLIEHDRPKIDARDAIVLERPIYLGGSVAQSKAAASVGNWASQEEVHKPVAISLVPSVLSEGKPTSSAYDSMLAWELGLGWLVLGNLLWPTKGAPHQAN